MADPEKPTKKRDQIQVGIWMSRALIEAIDAKVAEKQKGRLKRINRSEVVREVLLREFQVTEPEDE